MFLERVSRLLSRNYPIANLKESSDRDPAYRFGIFEDVFCTHDGKEMVPMSRLAGSYHLMDVSDKFPWLIYVKFVALYHYFVLNSSLMRDEGDFPKRFTLMERLLYQSIMVFFFAIYDLLKLPGSEQFIVFFVTSVEKSYERLSKGEAIKNYSNVPIERIFEKIDYFESIDAMKSLTETSDLYFFEKYNVDSMCCSPSELLSAFSVLFEGKKFSMRYVEGEDWKMRVKGRAKRSNKTFTKEYIKTLRETSIPNDYQYLSKYLGLYDAEKLLSVNAKPIAVASNGLPPYSIPNNMDEARSRGLFAILPNGNVFIPVEDSMFNNVPEDIVEIVDKVPEEIDEKVYFVKDLGIFLNPKVPRIVDSLPGLTIETAKGANQTFWDDRPYSKSLRVKHLVDIFLLLSFNVESLDAEVSIYNSEREKFTKYLLKELDELPKDFLPIEVSLLAKIKYCRSRC